MPDGWNDHPEVRRCDVCERFRPVERNYGWVVAQLAGEMVWSCPDCSRAAGLWDEEARAYGMRPPSGRAECAAYRRLFSRVASVTPSRAS